jgi:hypothetical protein
MKLGRLYYYDDVTGFVGGGGVSDKPPYIASNTLDVDYEDITSIENWDKSNVLDWSRRRDNISPLFYGIASYNLSTYGNLTQEQKIIGARYFFVPYSLRVGNGTITEQEDYDNGHILLFETQSSRIACIEAMRKYVWNEFVRKEHMSLANSQQLFIDITYCQSGQNSIDDFEKANISNFKNYVFNLSPFVGVFSSKTYCSPTDMVILQQGLQDIYNGKY